MDALPLRGKMWQFTHHENMDTLCCPMSHNALETANHLFLECIFSRVIWRESVWPLNVGVFDQYHISQWIKFILDSRNHSSEISNQCENREYCQPDWEKEADDHSNWELRWTPRGSNIATHNLAQWCASNDISGCVNLGLLGQRWQLSVDHFEYAAEV